MNVIEIQLRQDKRMKDDDGLLVATLWRNEIGEAYKTMTALDLLKMVAYNKLTKSSVIERARRKVQELNPGLRGTTYKQKKNYEKKVRKNLQIILN